MHASTFTSDLACPNCGFIMRMTMPTDSCLYRHECSHCKVLLRPKPGDCCVFCSYGSVKCPPRQLEQAHAANACRLAKRRCGSKTDMQPDGQSPLGE